MQSAAKCPILVSFRCQNFDGPDKYMEGKLIEKELEKSENFCNFEVTTEKRHSLDIKSYFEKAMNENHVMQADDYGMDEMSEQDINNRTINAR